MLPETVIKALRTSDAGHAPGDSGPVDDRNVYQVVEHALVEAAESKASIRRQWMLAGELAKRTSTPRTKVRYYTLIKLLPSVKASNGYHYYPPEAIDVMNYINMRSQFVYLDAIREELLTLSFEEIRLLVQAN